MRKFVIEDECHAEWQCEFNSFKEAMSELRRRSNIPWDSEPNICPCTGWKNCERLYTVTEYIVGDESFKPQSEVEVLRVSSKGVVWLNDFEKYFSGETHNNHGQ
ncbi:hypothetical protein HXX02_00190 [Microbulbifer elongatus]|uniref:Uncharacterized protein n=1 Tax=Microbulbifer elongatus TaxID=86173 RepID=A0ABT1NY90_9GAMM|nr:hypothetical protein [Microbulbifer elongatus]MCQ3827854.1 hypothetical protein [Microbulbifer elongatus]